MASKSRRQTSHDKNGHEKPASFKLHFADTKPHEFRMEYSHQSPLFGAGVSFDWQPPVDTLRQQAVDAAKQADAVVAFVGISPRLEGEEMPIHIPGFSGGDRTSIDLAGCAAYRCCRLSRPPESR